MVRSATNRAVAALLVAAFLFGATFVVVKNALDDIGALSFVGWRFLLGALVLSLFAFPRGVSLWKHGAISGTALFAGYALQTIGLTETTASNSALITGLFVVLTPMLAALFKRRAPSPWVVGAAVGSFVGLFLLTHTDGLGFSRGELVTLGAALAFALHIVAVARYAEHHPVVPFTTAQLTVTAALALPTAFVVEGYSLPPSSTFGALAITGIAVGVGAFLLQVWAQTVIGPGTAAVVLAGEPVFGVATGWVVLGERLDILGWTGAGLIVAAIYLAVIKQKDESFREVEAVTSAH